jgi:trimeric autotransporter adhesin
MRASPFLVRLVPFLTLAGASVLLSCGKDSTGVELGGVASVSVAPANDTVFIGATITLAATPLDANGDPLSGKEVFWHSEHPDIAVVSEDGAVTGIVPGDVRIAASVEGVAGFSTVTVLPKPPASIELSSKTLAITVGQESQLRATVRDAEGGVLGDAPVDWKSSNNGVATVSAEGVVHGVAKGTATITATSGTVNATATVTVSPVPANAVVVSPVETTIFVGEKAQLTGQVTDAGGDPLPGRPISWSSSASSVASVSGSGLVTAVAPGTAIITASSEGKSGRSTITVKQQPVASVDMEPSEVKLEIGKSTTIKATPKSSDGKTLTGRSVTWKSSNTAVATVNSSGLVTAKNAGSAIIQATSEGVAGTALVTVSSIPVASVVVSPDAATITVGQSTQLTAKTLDAEGDELSGRTVVWSSSNEDVASVSSSGKVLALSAGEATITATSEGKSGTAKITTVMSVGTVTVEPDSISVVVGETGTLTATVKDADGKTLTGRDIDWKSSNTAVATVDGDGVVTGVAVGSVTITATSEGKSGTATVAVILEPAATVRVYDPLNPDSPPTVMEGEDLQLLALPSDADGTPLFDRIFTWESSDESIATVSESGLVTGVTEGSVTITATTDGVSGSTTLTVTSDEEGNVVIMPGDTTLLLTQQADLKGLVIGSDGVAREDNTLSWNSDTPLVVQVSGNGHVQAIFPGSAIITASRPDGGRGTPGSAKVTVAPLGS